MKSEEISSVEELLALLKAFPDLADDKYVSKMKFHKYKEAKRRFKEIVLDDKTKVRILFIGDVQKWAFKALPKLEAFLKDHVSRTQLKKLINEMPCYEDMDDVGGMLPMVVQMFGVELDKWRQKVLEMLGK